MAEGRDEGIDMEREELAALRATRLAAERQTPSGKAWEARLGLELGATDGLPPYVLAGSCSDPRDRRVFEDVLTYRVLEQSIPGPAIAVPFRRPPPPRPPRKRRRQAPPGGVALFAAAATVLGLIWLAFLMAGRFLVP